MGRKRLKSCVKTTPNFKLAGAEGLTGMPKTNTITGRLADRENKVGHFASQGESRRSSVKCPTRLRYLQIDHDRHGQERHYVRVPGKRKVRLRAAPGSEQYQRDYEAALAGKPVTVKPSDMHPKCGRISDHAELAFAKARKRAGALGRAFTVSWDEMEALLHSQGYRCALSGLQFDLERNTQGTRTPYAPSLDRIDCARGYEPGNVRWVLTAVNIALSDWGKDQLLEIAAAMVVFNAAKTPA